MSRTTEAVSPDGTIYCETTFTRRGDLLWILSLTCATDMRAQAAEDLRAIAREFTLLR